jgi:hypothetical protein
MEPKAKLHGVGIYAIIDIHKGTYVFKGDKSKMVWIKEEDIKLSDLPMAI